MGFPALVCAAGGRAGRRRGGPAPRAGGGPKSRTSPAFGQ